VTDACPLEDRLEHYAKLVHGVTGAPVVLYLSDAAGLIAASDRSPAARETFDRVFGRLEPGSTVTLADFEWLSKPLRLGSQAADALLHVACRVGQAAPGVYREEGVLRELIASVQSGIEREWLQAETIENLSLELGNRYEELNLLYGIDDNLRTTGSASVDDVINSALENCVEFLNIDGASLHVPEHDLDIRLCGGALQAESVGGNDEARDATLLDMLRSTGEPLVLNGSVEVPPVLNGVALPTKLLAAPIFEGPQRLSGILCFVRRLAREPFTTSDRKIAEVVAAEVSKTLDARYDGVTGLMHRAAFEQHLASRRESNPAEAARAVLLQVDIDQFKLINDACGHAAGDRLLHQTGALLNRFLPGDATTARSGSDEYALLLPDASVERAQAIADDLLAAIAASRFVSREKVFDITVSIGIAEMSEGKTVSAALSEADIACNVAKELGGGRVRVYHGEDEFMQARHQAMQWASTIRAAVDEDRFELFGQAIQPIAPASGLCGHFEILLRLYDAEHTIVSPAVFIPAAERYGFMDRIDRMVVTRALETFVLYQRRGVDAGISVNISGTSLCDDDFRRFVVHTVRNSGVIPESICFEVTETAAVTNLGQALLFIDELADVGCRFALDDFGSGMSSYAYLRNLPVDFVKIDGMFVRNMVEDPFNRSIVESIHQISRASGMQTVAEFVEDDRTLDMLAEIGVDFAQGFVLDRPAPLIQKLEAALPPAAAVG
jgi:diguanylate cyclase (GGDEF)-like protein